ncbi:FAD-dependent monooxygenase [Noviherbaspirillum suwonense]|uniref:Ubiquinone biosynthesis hydroxylase, UbiH/UbiF/VisC/COQ6 family n=1 Tax=Noviherbaspirillum suwonense TaxID=1224511 RepID=A0ABY1Q3E1_9BURK|nr:FAD-dependent monooxygenase [Noviherbaspirillum suwonense]SMP53551.1 Ubiquinone biosynthesis hydroxylase, UbiH/UbiF/VisC/COQ6 family [Noviherbaspirillum suwonense]
MNPASDICVIGNGIIGKVAALGLAQAGSSVTLLTPPAAQSKAAPAGWDVRVYALNQIAHALLSSLRVWDALDASRIAPVDAMVVNGDGPEAAGRLAFDAYSARAGLLAWIVEDSNLNAALDAALRFAPNLKVISARAVRLEQDEKRATVHLDNGATVPAALVVGADGGQSWVRAQCDVGIDYRPYGQRAVVANFSTELPHHGAAHQWFTSTEGIVALLPLPGNQVSLVWSAPDALADKLMQEPLSRLAERLSALPRQPFGKLAPLEPENVRDIPLALIRPHAIVSQRVALVGDAAHVIHPLAGHGMNLGFADVASLLQVLAERGAERDCGDARLLRRYARERKEDILLMQVATDGLERLFSTEFEPLRIARNMGLNLLDQLPVLKRRLMAHAMGNPLAPSVKKG